MRRIFRRIRIQKLGEGYHVKMLTPGVAYSSNLHYLLFDGKSPDAVGFFTDYAWQQAEYKKKGKLFQAFDKIETFNNMYRMLTRKITKDNSNILFSEKEFFVKRGSYKFMTDAPVEVFDRLVDMAYEGNDI